MSGALLKYETIDKEQIAVIMKGEEPPAPKDWDTPTSSDDTPSSGGKEEEVNAKADNVDVMVDEDEASDPASS